MTGSAGPTGATGRDIFQPAGLRYGYRALLFRAGVDGLLEAGDQWAGSDWAIGAHSHACWELFLQLTDEPSRWDMAGDCRDVGRLQMLAVPPRTRHELLDPRPRRWHFYYASMDPGTLLADYPDSFAARPGGIPVWFGDASACREPFEAFLREVASTGPMRPDALRAAATHLLIAVGRTAQPAFARPHHGEVVGRRLASHPSIARAQALLQTRYDEPATMAQVGSAVGLSPAPERVGR